MEFPSNGENKMQCPIGSCTCDRNVRKFPLERSSNGECDSVPYRVPLHARKHDAVHDDALPLEKMNVFDF